MDKGGKSEARGPQEVRAYSVEEKCHVIEIPSMSPSSLKGTTGRH